MPSPHVRRKLTTILSADVQGYSRLMSDDEEATLETLKACRGTFDDLISRHGGRLVGTAGDAVLVEFDSAVEAVRCALFVQERLEASNADVAEDRRMRFRIGINVGDVMVEGDDLFGDGVNVAARVQALADPGGICITASAFEQVRNRLPADFEDIGPQNLRNIAEPVQVYRVLARGGAGAASRPRPSQKRWVPAAAALLLVAVAGGAGWWWWMWISVPRQAPPAEQVAKRLQKASIAVLPFVNMSGDKEQEYFSDGMTEDLITDLSKISSLTVISRTSTSGYKGRKIDIREVGAALGARYLVEGSVRKTGSQVRINAQLIDAATGGHLWAERYDGDLKDIFALQDRVREKIIGSLALTLSEKERRRLATRGTDSVVAHDLYLRGLFEESKFSREGNREAIGLYEQALAIDPEYPLPYSRISAILQFNPRSGWSDDVDGDLRKAVEMAEKAVALDGRDPSLHWMLGRAVVRLHTPGSLKRGIKSMERAIELDPDYADAYAFLSDFYLADGRANDSLRAIETAIRINPRYPFWYLFMRGQVRYMVKDYDSAIADLEQAAERSPTAMWLRWWLAMSYAQVGRQDDAEWQVEELKTMGFTGNIRTITETQSIQHPPFLKLYKEGLRKAGIPE